MYDIDFYYKGRRFITSTKTGNSKIAKQILGEIQGQIARGTFRLEKVAKKEIMLSAFIDKYLVEAATYKGVSTVALEKGYLQKLLATVGDRNLRSINQSNIDKWKKHIALSVKPATFNLERRTLHAIFNVAKKMSYIDNNPFTSVMRARTYERRLFLTEKELELLFNGIGDAQVNARRSKDRSMYRLFQLFVEFLLNTGLRRNEALNLRPQHVDLNRGVIYIERTKDKELRVVPLNSQSREILLSLGNQLFSNMTSNQVTHTFHRIAKDVGLKGFKLHSLRHTFASILVSRGVDLYTVSKILGHSDLKTTMVYAKLSVSQMQNAVDKLKLVSGSVVRELPEAQQSGTK